MKRRDELVVGVTVFMALVVVVAGTLWLSQADLARGATKHSARFRTVGGLGVGDPVVLRGVRVGRVSEIRLGERNWVEAEVQIYGDVALPADPAIVAASASLFGEWQAGIISLAQAPDDPNVRRALDEAQAEGDDLWPGATLPDIGQLTAQAGRIATDIASVSSRIQQAFDSTAVTQLQRSIGDFGRVADQIASFTEQQTTVLRGVGERLGQGSEILTDAAISLQSSLARVDSATNQGELARILENTQVASEQVAEATRGFNELVGAARENQQSLVRVIQAADSVMTRIQNRAGTIGLLVGDSTLYVETTLAVQQLRSLLADIQANPRKYFKFSVF
ncbi:MAG: MlaD family protein [Gemmatimonadota bacterium]|nr:MlaD family protein [Gemmatimonadota bacterium]MDH5198465.1 MlaD family protein [Gemmatimonadota bacterium]